MFINGVITNSSEWICVSGGTPLNSGTLMWDDTINVLRVNSQHGQASNTYPVAAEISLTPRANEVLMWAFQKMSEEQQLKYLCQEHPGLQEAYDKFLIMKAMVTK